MASLTIRSNLARWALIAAEAAAFLVALVWVAKSYYAYRMAQNPVVKDLQLATRLDPRNSEYHLRLGRLLQYSITQVNAELAMDHLKRAAALNPHDPQPWLELAAAYGFQGNLTEAETCLRRADGRAPRLPPVQWVIGNFFLLQGNTDEAFRHFQVVLAGTHEYDQILFRTAWKASDDGPKILAELIPRRAPTEFGYLSFLLNEKRIPEALAVWKRVAASSEAFDPALAAGFMEYLFAARLPGEAAQVWNDLRRKGLIKPIYQPTPQSLLINSDFEEDILNMGFDWRIAKVEGVQVSADGSNFHSPSRALLISFSGKANLNYQGLFQFVRVQPGRSYRLQGFLKTEGITTDSGPRLKVYDAYDRTLLLKSSESVAGTTDGWNQIILDFTAGPRTELVVVAVVRLPSTKLDNLIEGKAWVDDVSLTPLS